MKRHLVAPLKARAARVALHVQPMRFTTGFRVRPIHGPNPGPGRARKAEERTPPHGVRDHRHPALAAA